MTDALILWGQIYWMPMYYVDINLRDSVLTGKSVYLCVCLCVTVCVYVSCVSVYVSVCVCVSVCICVCVHILG